LAFLAAVNLPFVRNSEATRVLSTSAFTKE
jgi:hypothetical protein